MCKINKIQYGGCKSNKIQDGGCERLIKFKMVVVRLIIQDSGFERLIKSKMVVVRLIKTKMVVSKD